jgi:hypothetical protein
MMASNLFSNNDVVKEKPNKHNFNSTSNFKLWSNIHAAQAHVPNLPTELLKNIISRLKPNIPSS